MRPARCSRTERNGAGGLTDTSEPRIRRARRGDAAAVAEIWLTAFRSTYRFLPAHTDAEVRGWVADTLLPETEAWIATHAGAPIGFIALGDRSIEQLYLLPDWTGRGIGSRLVGLAQARRPDGLELWTFQVNTGARRFYERHGFRAVELTDGSGNEEHEPDVRYVWP